MKFDEGWVTFFSQELPKDYFKELAEAVQRRRNDGKKVYPLPGTIFQPMASTPFSDLKAVIVGEHPYSKEGYATGLAFSLPSEVSATQELKNIHTELNSSISKDVPLNTDLTSWAKGGILLLNNVLTTDVGDGNAHVNIGWEQFTQNCVNFISSNKEDRVVFALWGADTHKLAPYIDRKRHTVLKSASPEDGANGFFGCGHFIHLNQVTRLWE
jgi:uracil-DNA glycosylase